MLSVARALRETRTTAGPDPDFRVTLRRRVVAVASVHAPDPVGRVRGGRPARPPQTRAPLAPAPLTPSPLTAAPLTRSRRAGRIDRRWQHPRLAFLAGGLAALILVAGVALLASRQAVPGDTLYPIKRGGEGLELALVSDPQRRGMQQLTFAERRLTEVHELVRRNGVPAPVAPIDPPGSITGAVLAIQALQDMDVETAEGTALITGYAVRQASGQSLGALADWTTAQRGRVATMSAQVGGVLSNRAAQSTALLDRIQGRLTALHANLTCGCLSATGSDDLGPLPCSRCVPGGSAPRGPAGGDPTGDSAEPTAPTGSPDPSLSGRPTDRTGGPDERPTSTAPPATPALPPLPSMPDTGLPPVLPTVMLPT